MLNDYLVESNRLITGPKKPITHIIGLSIIMLSKKNVNLYVMLPSTNMFMDYIASTVKLPTKAFTKNGNGVPQTMEFKNVDYWNMKGMISIPQISYFPVMQKNV